MVFYATSKFEPGKNLEKKCLKLVCPLITRAVQTIDGLKDLPNEEVFVKQKSKDIAERVKSKIESIIKRYALRVFKIGSLLQFSEVIVGKCSEVELTKKREFLSKQFSEEIEIKTDLDSNKTGNYTSLNYFFSPTNYIAFYFGINKGHSAFLFTYYLIDSCSVHEEGYTEFFLFTNYLTRPSISNSPEVNEQANENINKTKQKLSSKKTSFKKIFLAIFGSLALLGVIMFWKIKQE